MTTPLFLFSPFQSLVTAEIIFVSYNVAEPEPPGAGTFRVELEPIFLLAGGERWIRLF